MTNKRETADTYFNGLTLDALRELIDFARPYYTNTNGARLTDDALIPFGRLHFRTPQALQQIIRKVVLRASGGEAHLWEKSSAVRLTEEDLDYIFRGERFEKRRRGGRPRKIQPESNGDADLSLLNELTEVKDILREIRDIERERASREPVELANIQSLLRTLIASMREMWGAEAIEIPECPDVSGRIAALFED